jgi:hypothetical protein
MPPWDPTEAIDQEVEKGSHLRHAVLAMRIDRRERYRIGSVEVREDWNQPPTAYSFADEHGGDPCVPPPAMAMRSAASALSTARRFLTSNPVTWPLTRNGFSRRPPLALDAPTFEHPQHAQTGWIRHPDRAFPRTARAA